MGGLYDAATLLVLSVPGDTLKEMGTLSVATADHVVAEIVRECCSAGVPGGVPWGMLVCSGAGRGLVCWGAEVINLTGNEAGTPENVHTKNFGPVGPSF